jgi:heme/copper-type cytochrome/quinol oxidase subunit 2
MPLPQNINAIIGAGVFGIVCAATLYVVEHYRQDRRRHAMAKDLARLNNELAVLRRELDSLLAQQKQK